MEKPKVALHKICIAKLEDLEIPNQACLRRCEELVPIELERVIANEFADYQVQRTAMNETCLDRAVFEIRLVENPTRSEHVASVTIHRCTKIAKREEEAKSKEKRTVFSKLAKIILRELEAQLKRVVSAMIIFVAASLLYGLNYFGLIDLSSLKSMVAEILSR